MIHRLKLTKQHIVGLWVPRLVHYRYPFVKEVVIPDVGQQTQVLTQRILERDIKYLVSCYTPKYVRDHLQKFRILHLHTNTS